MLNNSGLVNPFTKPLYGCKALLHTLVKYGFVKFILQVPTVFPIFFFVCFLGIVHSLLDFFLHSGWRVEAGSTRKYVLMQKPQPDPTQPEFGPWGLNSTRLNPFFHPKNGLNPKNRVGFGRTSLYSEEKSQRSNY